MAKSKVPDGMMDEVLGGKKDSAAGRIVPAGSPGDEDQLKAKTIMFPESWLGILQNHFRDRGMDFSNGLRQVIADYMDSQGLR